MHASQLSHEQAVALHERLEAGLPNGTWLRILEVFLPIGVVDSVQLHHAVGLSRNRFQRTLENIEAAAIGLPPVIDILSSAPRRPATRGPTPKVYALGETGAALLRLAGHPDARPPRIRDERYVLHALAMLDFHFAALRSGMEIHTDQVITYDEGQSLRPDHQVCLPDGRRLIYEIELSATSQLLPRIQESLRNKQHFFQGNPGYLPEVRMLVDLPHGRAYQRTLKTWRQVVEMVTEEIQVPLSFHLWVLRLGDFLTQPEWGEAVSTRWEDLTVSVEALPVPKGEPASDEHRALAYEQSRSIREDLLILQAMQQVYQEKEIPYQRQPDPAFLELVELIYAASHPGGSMIPPGLPHASLHLLRRYLEGRPVLQKSLRSAMHRGRGRTRWNPTLILQRVQRVATILMSYHGWGNCGALRVRAVTGDPNAHAGDVFGVHVEIAPFLWAQLQQPGPQAMREIQIALAWVVWALFEYAHDLGLGATEYW